MAAQAANRDKPESFMEIVFAFLIVMFCISGFFFLLLTAMTPTFPKGYDRTLRVVWDVKGLERELTERVYGQEEALREILRSVRDFTNGTSPTRHTRIVFLLGGPGVGKSHVINILKNHISCAASDNTYCELKLNTIELVSNAEGKLMFLDGVYKGTAFAALECNYLDKYINDQKNFALGHVLTYFHGPSERAIYFVTGRIFNVTTTSRLTSHHGYNLFLDEAAQGLDAYMLRHVERAKFSFALFRSLDQGNVRKCLTDQEVGTEQEISDIIKRNMNAQFLPQGCKSQ